MQEKDKIQEELKELTDWSRIEPGNHGFEVSEQRLLDLSEKALMTHKRQEARQKSWYRLTIAAAVVALVSVALWFNFTSDDNTLILAENGYADLYFEYLSAEAMMLEDEDLIEVLGDLYLQSLDEQGVDAFMDENSNNE
ncbi:MAG: hypothetical protein EA362_12575 [Saprospirales bacterium]|nr:MAG: hypothetical protein EA362_12575 [Saprospirales bacterium]